MVAASFVSPTEKVRQIPKDILKNLKIVHVKCSPEECARRDVKGMWKKAKNGEIKDFTGVDAVYEEPKDCFAVLDTENNDLDKCVNMLIDKLMQ